MPQSVADPLVATARGQVLAALHSDVDRLAREDIAGATDTELSRDILHLRGEVDRLEGECCRRLAEFDRRRAFEGEGSTSTVSWLRVRARMHGGEALQRVEAGRQLRELPHTAEALRDGLIGFQ